MKILFIALGACALLLGMDACKKKVDDPLEINVRTNNIPVNWYRDASTSNPRAFIDFYNGTAYTESEAVAHASTTDAFVFDHGIGPIIFQQIDFVNMAGFASGFYSKDSFAVVVGILPFSTYTSARFSPVSMNNTEFDGIRYNSDIASLWSSKSLNGGYGDMNIATADLTNMFKYYQFVASNGRRGFFHVVSSNYLPGGTMTIAVKVEQ